MNTCVGILSIISQFLISAMYLKLKGPEFRGEALAVTDT